VGLPWGGIDVFVGIIDIGKLFGFTAVVGFLAETKSDAGSTAIFGTAFNAPISREFNSDALSDLVWRRPSDGLTEIQYLSGINTIGGGVIANDPFSANWSLITTADANGDGISDLVYQRPSDGLVEVALIGGDTSTGPRVAGGGA